MDNRTETFVIENEGTGVLEVSAISETEAWLSITADPLPIAVQSGNTTSFQVTMWSTNVTEIQHTIITIISNDPEEPQYDLPVTMKVGISDDPPTVRIVVPDVAIVNELITIQVDAADDKGLDSIAVYFAGSWHSQNCSGVKNCSGSWTTSEVSPGQYTYKAKGKDRVGQWSREVEASIDVQSQAIVHDLSIIDYQIPSSVTEGETVILSVTIENQGEREDTSVVTFLVNDTLIHSEPITLVPNTTVHITHPWTAPKEAALVTITMLVDAITGELDTTDNIVTGMLNTVRPAISEALLSWLPLTISILVALSLILWRYARTAR